MAFGGMLRRVLQIIFKCCCCCFSKKDTQDTDHHEINEVFHKGKDKGRLRRKKKHKSIAQEDNIDVSGSQSNVTLCINYTENNLNRINIQHFGKKHFEICNLEKVDGSKSKKINGHKLSLNQLRDSGRWSTTEDENDSDNEERTHELTSLSSTSAGKQNDICIKSKKNRHQHQLSNGSEVVDGRIRKSNETEHPPPQSPLQYLSLTTFSDSAKYNIDTDSIENHEYQYVLLNTEEKLNKFCSSPCGETINQPSSTISGDCTLIAERSLDHQNTDNCFYNPQPLADISTNKNLPKLEVINQKPCDFFDAGGKREGEENFVKLKTQPPVYSTDTLKNALEKLFDFTTLLSPAKINDLLKDPQQFTSFQHDNSNVQTYIMEMDTECRNIPESTPLVVEEIISQQHNENENVSPHGFLINYESEESLIRGERYNSEKPGAVTTSEKHQPGIEVVNYNDSIPPETQNLERVAMKQSSLKEPDYDIVSNQTNLIPKISTRRNRSHISYKERNKQAAKLYRENKKKEREVQTMLENLRKEADSAKQQSHHLEKSLDFNANLFVDEWMKRAKDEDHAVNIFSDLVKDHLQNIVTQQSTNHEAAEIALFRDWIMPKLKRKHPVVYKRVQALWVCN